MNFIKRDWIAFIAILFPIIYLAAIYNSLPQTVPTHWDLNGQINGWGNKATLWLMPFLLPVLVYIIFSVVTKIDPKGKIKNNSTVHRLKVLLTVFMSVLCCYIIYCSEVQKLKFSPFLLIGLMFIIIGNYMYSLKPNYFIGIRTPWTLENEEVWRKTHRTSAPVWVVAGLLLCILSFILSQKTAYVVCMIIVLTTAFFSILYSYIIWKKLK